MKSPTTKPRLLLASESYWPWIDGGATLVRRLATLLRGFDVHVITFNDRSHFEVTRDGPATLYRMPAPSAKMDHAATPSWMLAACWLLPRSIYPGIVYHGPKIDALVERIQPDLAHIHHFFWIGRAVFEACRKRRVPILATNHWLPENLHVPLLTGFESGRKAVSRFNWSRVLGFCNQCSQVTAPSRTALQLLRDHGLSRPGTAISNGIDLHMFDGLPPTEESRKLLGLPDKPIVLYTGRMAREKCIDVLLKAVPRVLARCDAHFVIGGSGELKTELMQLARELGVGNSVTFPGFLDETSFRQLYKAADIYVMPSIAELQCITLMEAMTAGLPAVVADSHALPELVSHGENGYLFPPHDVRVLADHIAALLENADLRHRMSRDSLHKIQSHGIDNTISRYEAILGEVLE